ncbi:glycosyltransferase family 4 protein [Roseibium sp. MMSF_3544]|uniref:glycosyltransferase family 4 protein n=1 Tax=unclassified Roseibium TaxID=2629323 RepID=UPI00273FFEF3|nr:glycosyltransferase family 4 protein [Roseibium sp. MMSF_3544]
MNENVLVNPTPITFFPDYRATNPYQTLHYESLEPAFRAEPGTIEDALERQAAAPGKPHLFHLHWEHAAFIGSRAARIIDRFLDDISRFQAGGGKVIWTIHNLAPHDEQKSAANADLQSGLAQLADVLHLHSLPALAAARSEINLPDRQIRVIAHQNYEGAYPVYARTAARTDLGLASARLVILCPGRIAPYKQPSELAEAFLAVAGSDDRLVIAGETARNFILNLPKDERLVHRDGFATPEDVGKLHAAADFVILPYRASLTSGSAILAATLGRAVVGPDTAGLRDVVAPNQTGLIYQTGDLSEALKSAVQDDAETWAARGRAAAELVSARNRTIIAAQWKDVLLSLVRPAFKSIGAPI